MPPRSRRRPATTPIITNKREENSVLLFTLSGLNVSYVNALRRTILSDIPTVAFRVFPHKENDANFEINTSSLTNEVLKQRLGCIPIHITDHKLPYSEIIVEVDVENTGATILEVSTDSFKLRNEQSGKLLAQDFIKRVFPPDPTTGDHILFCRLRPRVSDKVPGEQLKLTARMSLQTAGVDAMYNVCSTCSYGMTPDKTRQAKALAARKSSEEHQMLDKAEAVLVEQDWLNHEAKRIFVRDSFDFMIETIGVFTNSDLVIRGCRVLTEKLTAIRLLSDQGKLEVNLADSTLPNSLDITLRDTGHSVGKVIEHVIYARNYRDDKTVSYIGFRRTHPHDSDSLIRIAFKVKQDDLVGTARATIGRACMEAVEVLGKIASLFTS